MHNTIGSLLGGRPVEKWYSEAFEKWSDLIAKHGEGTDELAKALEFAQAEFEDICDDLDIGKEVMAITGVAYYYTQKDGFGDANGRRLAQQIYRAISRSNCSGEVHTYADRAAELFSLDLND